jgi:predicted nucleic acid-binding protein
MVQRDVLTLADLDRELMLRCVRLMERYRDHRMDLADAALIALAETRDVMTIFTVDDCLRP